MSWNTIVAGVEATDEGAWAGNVAWRMTGVGGGRCHLVHAAYDLSTTVMLPPSIDFQEVTLQATAAARGAVEDKLREHLPDEALAALDVRIGKPALVLADAAHDADADLIVVGGRHHAVPARWFGGSTVKHLIRKTEAPVLVAVPPTLDFKRVLIGADLSDVTAPTIQAARRFAEAYQAALRVVHIVEPLPYDYAGMIHQPDEYMHWSEQQFAEVLRASGEQGHVESAVLYGPAVRTLTQEAQRWHADLIVVGSHGKGFVDRLLLGSTTMGLINRLPTSLLVVPPGRAAATEETSSGDSTREKVLV